MAESFGTDFRRFFIRGLAAVLPTLLTVAIIIYVFTFLNNNIATHVNTGAKWVVQTVNIGGWSAPQWVIDKWDTYFWWVGFFLSLIGIYIFGRFVASFLGRMTWRVIEKAFFRLPVVKQIYPYVKQVTDFLLSEKKMAFSRVVAVEYPRKGIWSLGLVTGAGMRAISAAMREDHLTVFVPSSPTPLTGYVISVRRDEVIDLPLSIDDAIRFAISGGVIMPPGQLLGDRDITKSPRSGSPSAKNKEVLA